MSAGQRLKDLEDAKRLLVLQSELHRRLLRLEFDSLCDRFAGVSAVRRSLRGGRPLLLGGAVLAGLLAVRRWRGWLRWVPTAAAAYRWLSRLL